MSSSRDLNQVDWNAEFNGHSINLPVICSVCAQYIISCMHTCLPMGKQINYMILIGVHSTMHLVHPN